MEDVAAQAKEIRERMMKSAIMAQWNIDSYINPQHLYNPSALFFTTYIQLPFWLIFAALLVVLHRLLWGPGFLRKYGFMSAYSILEMILFFTECFAVLLITVTNKDYILYEWCHLFIVLTQYLPLVVTTWCRWLWTGQAFQRFMIVYFPLSYNKYVTKRFYAFCALLLVVVSGGLSYIHYLYDYGLEKVVTIDRSEMKLVEACRYRQEPGQDGIRFADTEIGRYLYLLPRMILLDILPLILIISFSTALVVKIKQQAAFRRRFKSQTTSGTNKEDDRILYVVTATTILSGICVIDICVGLVLCFDFRKCTDDRISIIDITYKTLRLITLLVSFFLFAYLASSFRQLLSRVSTQIARAQSLLSRSKRSSTSTT